MVRYIGLEDFISHGEVEAMKLIFNRHLPQRSTCKLHVGVMMSRKTLLGLPTKWATVFPSKESIKDIFASTDVYNCLHYVSEAGDSGFTINLETAISYCGDNLHAVQLDMTWPEPDEIQEVIHAAHHDIEVILQIGNRALEEVGDDPWGVLEVLKSYQGIVERIMIDRSMGRGKGLDAQELLRFYRVIKSHIPEIGFVAAGGLGPYTLNLIEPLLAEFPDISIDAQGQLRPSGNSLEPVDWCLAGQYIINALELLEGSEGGLL